MSEMADLLRESELVNRFKSEDKANRPFLVAEVLAANRDSFRCILSVAATRSIDQDAFVQGLLLALSKDPANLPGLRLLTWHQIRAALWNPARETLAELIKYWPHLSDTRRELVRVGMMSPGSDDTKLLDQVAPELHNRVAQLSYRCQHMLAHDHAIPESAGNELRLNIDHECAEIFRKAALHDGVIPPVSTGVFFDILRKIVSARSVALVGNGPSLLGSKCGDRIDSHEVVIRFNFPVFLKFQEDVGSRVDVVFFNESLVSSLPQLRALEPAYSECLSLAFHPEPEPRFEKDIYYRNMTSRVSRIPSSLRDFYRSFFYARPTTGMMGIILLSVILGKDVTAFGFDFYKQATAHYYPSSSPVFLGHEVQYEQWFMEKFLCWLRAGNITDGTLV